MIYCAERIGVWFVCLLLYRMQVMGRQWAGFETQVSLALSPCTFRTSPSLLLHSSNPFLLIVIYLNQPDRLCCFVNKVVISTSSYPWSRNISILINKWNSVNVIVCNQQILLVCVSYVIAFKPLFALDKTFL